MPRRTWMSPAMLATGGALLLAAQLAGAAPERNGGVFKIGNAGASVKVDPQLAYTSTAWGLEYATAAKLYNYRPGGRLVPEVSSGFKVSDSGRRYTFFIRKGFRFSDGTPVTAASFKYAIDRGANHDLHSPGVQFITDPNAVDIVGAQAVNDGNGTSVRGVRVRGRKLMIDMTTQGTGLLRVLTMPFFQATSTKLPLDREVDDVRSAADLPSAGPYAFVFNDVNRLTQLRRNRFWKRGPGRTATPKLGGVDIQWNLDQHTTLEMVKAGQLDESWVPNDEVQAVAAQYGVNRSQFWLEPTNCLFSIAFNNRSGIFHANARLRRAVNFALDRTDFVADLPYAQTPWTHLLPPGFPGSVRKPSLQPYGAHSDIERARQLAAGHYRDGRVALAYRALGRLPARAQTVRRDLERLGLTVTMLPFGSGDLPRDGWDMLIWFGECYDLPDSSALLSAKLGALRPAGSKYVARLRAADALRGSKRLQALGKLDLDIMRNAAPVAVMHTYDNRYFFSSRVDPRSLKYHAVYQDWSIPALALK